MRQNGTSRFRTAKANSDDSFTTRTWALIVPQLFWLAGFSGFELQTAPMPTQRKMGTGRELLRGCHKDTHFFRMPIKMRSLELSL